MAGFRPWERNELQATFLPRFVSHARVGKEVIHDDNTLATGLRDPLLTAIPLGNLSTLALAYWVYRSPTTRKKHAAEKSQQTGKVIFPFGRPRIVHIHQRQAIFESGCPQGTSTRASTRDHGCGAGLARGVGLAYSMDVTCFNRTVRCNHSPVLQPCSR
jgi:hypothetical protein